MPELTEKQRAIYEYVKHCILFKRQPPTMQEIAAEFGFNSWNAAQSHIRLILAKGWLTKRPGRVARGLMLPKGRRSVWESLETNPPPTNEYE